MAWIDESTPVTLFNDILNNIDTSVADKIESIKKVPIQDHNWQIYITNSAYSRWMKCSEEEEQEVLASFLNSNDLSAIKNVLRKFGVQIIDAKLSDSTITVTVVGDSTMKDAENLKKDWDKYCEEQNKKPDGNK